MTVEQLGLARNTDPRTSHAAAHRQRGGVEGALHDLFATGWTGTDEQTYERLRQSMPELRFSTMVSARSRLTWKDDARHADGVLVVVGEGRGSSGAAMNVYGRRA